MTCSATTEVPGPRGMAKPPRARYLSGRMNQHERTPRPAVEAEVRYLDGDFRVLRPGTYVRCAVTGAPIPLDELRYWSAERQEAYAGPDVALRRLTELNLLPKT